MEAPLPARVRVGMTSSHSFSAEWLRDLVGSSGCRRRRPWPTSPHPLGHRRGAPGRGGISPAVVGAVAPFAGVLARGDCAGSGRTNAGPSRRSRPRGCEGREEAPSAGSDQRRAGHGVCRCLRLARLRGRRFLARGPAGSRDHGSGAKNGGSAGPGVGAGASWGTVEGRRGAIGTHSARTSARSRLPPHRQWLALGRAAASSRRQLFVLAPFASPHCCRGDLETSLLEQALASSEPDIRSAALESGCILGVRGAFSSVQSTVKGGGPGFGAAALLLGLSGEEGAVAALAPGLTRANDRADSIFALGFTGRVSAVEASFPC